jgi:uncharacterized protein (DUF1684 family)
LVVSSWWFVVGGSWFSQRSTSSRAVISPLLPYSVIAAVVLVSACSSGPAAPDADFLGKEIARREARDRQFREDKDPIPADKRAVLLPLRYYPPDPGYSVAAALRLGQERPVVPMPTSTGTIRRYERVGVLEFTFQGQNLSLGAFIPEGTREIEGLFVPFVDATSGKETYPAGRYLDIPPTTTGLYEIDFNKAYNPYCAYNATYECPYPPPSNRLKVEIRAGEKAPGA